MHAFAHITGGGIPGNLVRVLPDRCDAVVTRGAWEEPRIFSEIQRARRRSPTTRWSTCSISGSACSRSCPPDAALHAVDIVRAAGHDAWLVGEIVDGHGRVHVARALSRRSAAE